jgi:DNA-3-methyladenine glycosylase
MPESNRITREFFNLNTLIAARQLLGQRLVKIENEGCIAGIITECEAYRGEEDLGCHAKAGLTPRTRVMYGPSGLAYVYFTYGMHWMLNIVTENEGFPAAILIRGLVPTVGIDIIARRRKGQPRQKWTDGPGKICQAFLIDQRFNGVDICSPESILYIEYGFQIPDESVTKTPRVGLNNVPEPWKSIPWRYKVKDGLTLKTLEDKL